MSVKKNPGREIKNGSIEKSGAGLAVALANGVRIEGEVLALRVDVTAADEDVAHIGTGGGEPEV